MATEKIDVARPRRPALGAGEVWAFGGASAYALTNIFSRIASVAIDPLAAPVFRLIPTLAISWAQVGRAERRWSTLKVSSPDFVGWRAMLVLFLGGAVGSAVGTVAFFAALEIGGVALTAPVLATNILWSAILAALFLKERLNATMALGIVIAMAGVAVLGYGRAEGSQVLPEELAAIPLTIVTAMSWATAANCARYALTRGVDKYLAIALSQSCGILLLIAILFLSGRGALLWTTALGTLGVLLVAGLLSATAQIFDTHALSLTTVASVLTIGGLNPVISTILAVLFLDEALKPLMAVGTLLTVAGVIVMQLSKDNPAKD
jgi:drug/metabolite transporter (DMT)-like permease